MLLSFSYFRAAITKATWPNQKQRCRTREHFTSQSEQTNKNITAADNHFIKVSNWYGTYHKLYSLWVFRDSSSVGFLPPWVVTECSGSRKTVILQTKNIDDTSQIFKMFFHIELKALDSLAWSWFTVLSTNSSMTSLRLMYKLAKTNGQTNKQISMTLPCFLLRVIASL